MSTAAPFAVVGQPVVQIEGVAKVSGKARFSADVLIPGTLWCRIMDLPITAAKVYRGLRRAIGLPRSSPLPLWERVRERAVRQWGGVH